MFNSLSQEQIDALMNANAAQMDAEPEPVQVQSEALSEALDAVEIDALGEIGNITMGTSATTLSQLLNRSVTITTPKVSIISVDELVQAYPMPYIGVLIRYTMGLKGYSVLHLGMEDVKLITDLMMGGTGTYLNGEVGEIHLSAIAEAMNQMIGSAATSQAQMLGTKIDISPPKPYTVNYAEEIPEFLNEDKELVRILFDMRIGETNISEISQLIPVVFAKDMARSLLSAYTGGGETATPVKEPIKAEPVNMAPTTAPPPTPVRQTSAPVWQDSVAAAAGAAMGNVGYGYAGTVPYGQPQAAQWPQQGPVMTAPNPISVKPAGFPVFDSGGEAREVPHHLQLLEDVPLLVTVELGRTKKNVKDVLKFNIGSVIELNKLAGEDVDIIVNGIFIAKGEVVVIEDSYAVRVTEVITRK